MKNENKKTSIEDSMLTTYSFCCMSIFGDMRYIFTMKGKDSSLRRFQIFEN